MRNKYINEPNLKECHTCRFLYENPALFFAKNRHNRYGLLGFCKKCDNKRRTLKEREKAYFNMPFRCKECNGFFYASKAMLNKSKILNNKIGHYCSRECSSLHDGMKGKSWNGRRKGTNNPNYKHDLEKIKKAKSLIQEGMRLVDISKIIGISYSYLYAIKTNKRWKDLTI